MIAINVRIVCKDGRRQNRHRSVFVGRYGICGRDVAIVDRRNVDGGRRRNRCRKAVVDIIAERRNSIEICRWRVTPGPIGVIRDGSGIYRHVGNIEGVTVDIRSLA